jgi:hypothetical protein
MKSISLWGYHHKWAARAIIVLCYIVLNILALFLGDGLLAHGIEVNALWVYLFTGAYLSAFLLYPFRRERKRYRNFYRWQKTCDAVLVTTSFLILISAANLRHSSNTPFQFPAARAVAPASIHPPKSVKVEKKEKNQSYIKSIKKKLSNTLQKFRAYFKSRSLAGQIFLTVLAVMLAGLALYGILGLACSLSCAGSDAAAAVVGILGTAAVVFLFVRALRGIRRLPRKDPEEKPLQATG